MLHLTDISKSFGTQTVLDGASLHIKPGMRLGLVGANGAGKTTLMRLIAGDMSLDGGEISGRKDLRIGFLPQEIEEIARYGVLEEVLASYKEILAMEERLHRLGEALALNSDDGDRTDGLLHEMGSLQTAFEAARGYELEARAQSILRGMGFHESDFHRPIAELSGGWRMRVALARLLLEKPDLLMLDEPTNHLDLESLLWLEVFLLDWRGALMVISHDRYFLNRLVTHIVELDRGLLDLYAGDYDHFEQEKRQRFEALVSAARNQQRQIDQAENFIRRFRAKNTKAKQVQQKVRQLERMDRVDAPELERKTINFRFPQPGRTGRVAAELHRVRKAFGSNVVYGDLNLTVERGEKIALVGPNGAGKSTLLKLLAGQTRADRGSVKLGYHVRREYFAQHQLEVLNPDQTVLKSMEEVAGPANRMLEVRAYLGAFLFSGDDVEKKVGILSGGEKSRLALARMLMDPAGLLLLDEPTNHLDMDSRGVLTEALRQFEGSIVFISHDRSLINAIATKVIEVQAGSLTHYAGDWEYYVWKKARMGEGASQASAPAARAASAAGPGPGRPGLDGGSSAGRTGSPGAEVANGAIQGEGKTAGRADSNGGTPRGPAAGGAAQRMPYRERKDIQRRYRQVEKRITTLEARQEELAGILSDPIYASDYQMLLDASDEAAAIREELSSLYEEWESVAAKVAALDEET